MNVTAEMILDIASLKASAAAAERRLNSIADVGERAGRRMNRGFAFSVFDRAAGGLTQKLGLDVFRGAPKNLSAFQISLAAAGGVAGSAVSVFTSLVNTITRLTAVAGGAAGAFAGWRIGQSVIDAGEFEATLLQMQVFAKSASEGRRIMEELAAFSPTTPFQLPNLEKGTLTLLSAGVALKDVVDLAKELARISEDDQAFLGLTEAYGKGFTKQKFDQEQLNQFLERGVNLYPYLAKVRGQAMADLMDSISGGEVNAQNLRDAFRLMSQDGGQFFGMLERRSQTLPGLWSTMQDMITQLQRAMGRGMLEPTKDILRDLLGQFDSLKLKATGVGVALGNMEAQLAAGLATGNLGMVISSWFDPRDMINDILKQMLGLSAAIRMATSNATAGIFAGMGTAWTNYSSALTQQMLEWASGVSDSIAAIFAQGMAKAFRLGEKLPFGLGGANAALAAAADESAAAYDASAKRHFQRSDQAGAYGPGATAEPVTKAILDAIGQFRNLGELKAAIESAVESGVAANGGRLEGRTRGDELWADIVRLMDERAGRRPAGKPFNSDAGTGITPPDATGAAGKTGPLTMNGSLDQDFRRLAGRSMTELVVNEAKQQNSTLRKIEGVLREIKGKLGGGDQYPEFRGGQFVYP